MNNIRKSIIEKNKFTEWIDFLFPFYKHYISSDKILYKSDIQFDIYETDKFFIITTPKSGSSIIGNIFIEYNLVNEKYHLSNLELIDILNNNNIIYPSHSIKGNHEFIKLLNGKSDKDLIIAIRNPIYKWISGIIQDIEIKFEKTKLIDIGIYDIEFKDMIFSEFISSDSIKNDIKKSICSTITYSYLKSIFKRYGKTTINHASIYNEFYYLLLQQNSSINLNKLLIVDLDSNDGDMVSVFKKYYPKISEKGELTNYSTKRIIWNLYFENITSLFNNEDDIILSNVKNDIEQDFYYYNALLYNYEKNIFKLDKNILI